MRHVVPQVTSIDSRTLTRVVHIHGLKPASLATFC
jgi:hypothetical protein